ncbi:MAG TPA: putative porin, partial [Sphingorhabdus sp.]|nr:putative porin [Sphingorhabdus sp.]
GATYDVNKILSVGARLVTGDPDDPNTSDITLSNFDDDLNVALDQAYVRAKFGQLELTAGKIPQTFRKTEMVWDDDVNPQGVSAKYDVRLGGQASITARGLYFVIDENAAMADSTMIGAQAGLDLHPGKDWTVQLSGAWYDYRLRSLAGGDNGDFGGNLRNAQGGYLSDFNIIDILGSVRWVGLAARWPLTITANFVHNNGAIAHEGGGLALLASMGRTSTPGDWQFGYTYMKTDADAVLAAFSHDNITLSTDYVQHGIATDYVLRPNVRLNATYYRFHPQHSAVLRGAMDQWSNRLRLNLLLGF